MYKKIMVPVDLEHLDKLGKTLNTATNLASYFEAPIVYIGVSTAQPSSVAHNPAEYEKKLEDFAAQQAQAHGVQTTAKAYIAHDQTAQLNEVLLKAVSETAADLVIMGSHTPGPADHIWAGHGPMLASHSGTSVFLVR